MVGRWTGGVVALAERQMFIYGHLGFGLVESIAAGAQMVMGEIGVCGVGGSAGAVQGGFRQGGMAEGHKEPGHVAHGRPQPARIVVFRQHGIPRVPAPEGVGKGGTSGAQ